MSATLIVDAGAAEKRARHLFPSSSIANSMGLRSETPDLSPYKGTEIVLWCHSPDLLADQLHGTASKISIVQGEKFIQEFNGNAEAVRHWLRANVRAYSPPTSISDPRATPDNIVAPTASEAAAVAANKPVTATVTPIAEARTRQQAKAQEEPVEYAEFAEDALTDGFSERHPELRYVALWKQWLIWDEAGWKEDTILGIYHLARLYCRAAANGQPNAALSSKRKVKSSATRAAVENLARSDPRHASMPAQWDADPLALNTPGGLVNLVTGSLRPVRMDDYCRKITGATPIEGCPQWLEFLKYGTDGDEALQGFLQRWAGMNMTGLTREQKFVFLHGRGGAGKGTFVNMIARILGSYARKIAMDSLTEQQRVQAGSSHAEDLVRLAGARMGYAAETQQGKRWNEARIKELTGEDMITARAPFASASIEFLPQLKLTIMGNHPPGLRSVGNEMRRRLLIVPFDHLPPVPDLYLSEKLWAERDGILFWMLCGAIDWQADGLRVPESVRRASMDYFDNQDMTGQWIADKCETDAPACNLESTIRTLYGCYRPYCEATGYQSLRQGELRDELLSRGFKKGGYASAPTIKGIRLRESSTQPDGRYPD